MFRFLTIKIIRFYQATISPDHGIFHRRHVNGFCKYYPSCSQYTLETIEKNGVIVGAVVGVYRILRCNPISRGGYDISPDFHLSKFIKYL